MAQTINDALFLNKGGVLCAKYGPWDSIQQMLDELPESFREDITVGIRESGRIVEYWFQGGVLEAHLEPKLPSAYEELSSAWIRKPVMGIVEDLPLAPAHGDRYLHEQVIVEYIVDSWHDRVGGTGMPLQDGMCVMVNQEDGLDNIAYKYNTGRAVWEPLIEMEKIQSKSINDTIIVHLHFVSMQDGSVWRLSMNPNGTLQSVQIQ